MRLVLLVCSLVANATFAQTDSARCYATCRFAPVYTVDTVKVVDLPARKKTVRIPEVYEVTVDTIVDEAASKMKPYPPVFEVSVNKRGEPTFKRLGGDEFFFLYKKTIAVERKKLLAPADVATVDLPPTYVTVYEKKLDPRSAVEQTVEMLCEEKITPLVVTQVHRELTLRGYNPGAENGKATGPILDALAKYQADFGLPVCGFNLPTLEHLGVAP